MKVATKVATHCWIGLDGGWNIGTPLVTDGSRMLMQQYHSGQIYWVDNFRLKPYPSSPIPNPGE